VQQRTGARDGVPANRRAAVQQQAHSSKQTADSRQRACAANLCVRCLSLASTAQPQRPSATCLTTKYGAIALWNRRQQALTML
jgi:hypothetical protein